MTTKEHRTTEDLRETLFTTIDQVANGQMDRFAAREVSNLASRIIDTAELELKYSMTVSRLDRDGQNVSPGPLLLTGKA